MSEGLFDVDGSPLTDYIQAPPSGVTFALPQNDAPRAFKDLVLGYFGRMDWSRYYGRPDDAISRGPFGWAEHLGIATHFSFGAEAAILAYTQQFRPNTILCPKYSYPGYCRVAKAVSARVETFAGAGELVAKAKQFRPDRTLIIITIPGNPLDSNIAPEHWGDFGEYGVVIDCAYEPPDSELFKTYARAAVSYGMPVVHSMAKSYPLAGLRLGGLMSSPSDPGSQFVEPRFWTALSCAVMESLADPAMQALLLEQRRDQRGIKVRMLEILSELGCMVYGKQSDLYVTIKCNLDFLITAHKKYDDKFMRIDCSRTNLLIMEDLSARA